MRVLLIHPGIHGPGAVNDFPPWGVLSVATYLRHFGHAVEVIDACGQEISVAVSAALDQFQPDVVGFTAKMGLAAARMRQGVELVRRLTPRVRIFAGGPLTSTFADLDADVWSGVDAIVLGDGETGARAWIDQDCPTGRVITGGPLSVIDPFGLADWWAPLAGYRRPAAWWPGFSCSGLYVSGGRGCTKRCTFCYLNTHSPAVRFRYTPTATLFALFDRLQATAGVAGFYFVDDCFLDAAGVRIAEFRSAQLRRGLPYRFGCDVQLEDLASPDTRRSLWEAGFRALYVGIESFSYGVRKRLGKGAFRGSLDQVVRDAQDDGFFVRASIGIGWPGESEKEVEDTIAFADRQRGLAFDAFRYTPLHGAPLTTWRVEKLDEKRGSAGYAEDYSEYGINWSAIEDGRFLDLWTAFSGVRAERERRLGLRSAG